LQIGVLYNCQHRGISAALRGLLPRAEVIDIGLGDVPATPQARRATAATLNACDHVVTYEVGRANGPLATPALRRTARRLHAMPAIMFRGFHPDTVSVSQADGSQLVGTSMGSHSRIAVAGYLAGMNPAETALLYNRLVFRRLGYLDVFAGECALLVEYFAQFGIDAPPLLQSWLAEGCFMHSVNHPKIRVLLDLARAACAKMGVTPENPELAATDLHDALEAFPIHPVFPDIAAEAGVAPEGMFRTGMTKDGQFEALTAEQFVTQSFGSFGCVSGAVLLRTDGVRAALAALDLAG
jgi:hypothetical protein